VQARTWVESSHAKAQKQEDAEVGRQKWAGRQEYRQMSREGIR
jgi:hypothetical protein